MVLAQELLHVFRRRAAGAGLEQPAAIHQRHDREHLRAGTELEDRKQVSEVVAQDVAGDRDGVLSGARSREREPGGGGDVEDLDLQAAGIQLVERTEDLAQHLRVVWSSLVKPEHGGAAGRARA